MKVHALLSEEHHTKYKLTLSSCVIILIIAHYELISAHQKLLFAFDNKDEWKKLKKNTKWKSLLFLQLIICGKIFKLIHNGMPKQL